MLDSKIDSGAHQVNEHHDRQQYDKKGQKHQQGRGQWLFPFVFAGENKHGLLQEDKQSVRPQQGRNKGMQLKKQNKAQKGNKQQ